MTNRKEKIGNGFCHVYLIILSVIAFFPLVWVLLCSVKASGELTSQSYQISTETFYLR